MCTLPCLICNPPVRVHKTIFFSFQYIEICLKSHTPKSIIWYKVRHRSHGIQIRNIFSDNCLIDGATNAKIALQLVFYFGLKEIGLFVYAECQ